MQSAPRASAGSSSNGVDFVLDVLLLDELPQRCEIVVVARLVDRRIMPEVRDDLLYLLAIGY